MKTDIALHEIMRIAEQDEEHTEHISLADPTQADAKRPTLGQPFMKSEEVPSGAVDDEIVATQAAASGMIDDTATTEEAPSGAVDYMATTEEILSDTVNEMVTTDEAPSGIADEEIVATEVPVPSPVDDTTAAEGAPASQPDDTTAAQPVMILHEASSDVSDATVAEKSPVSRPDDTTAAQPVMSLHALPSDVIDTPDEPIMDDGDLSIAPAETSAPESSLDDNRLPTDSPVETLLAIKTNIAGFFDEVVYTIATFYRNNQQLLITLGITLLAIMGIKLLFAGVNAIDDIPLVTPLLKLIGLVYVVRFVWRYLIREQDRHELVEKIDRVKAEVLGSEN